MARAIRNYSSIKLSIKLLTRFFSHITVTNTGYKTSCWIWHPHNWQQYGSISIKGAYYCVHRTMYYLFVEPIEYPLHTDHLCRIPACVNPAHLEAVTAQVNTLRGVGPSAENAQKTYCYKGHPLTEDNLYVHKHANRKSPTRKCRICTLEEAEKRRRKLGGKPRRDNSEFCKNGHSYLPDNLYMHPRGYKMCRICRKAEKKTRKLKQKN